MRVLKNLNRSTESYTEDRLSALDSAKSDMSIRVGRSIHDAHVNACFRTRLDEILRYVGSTSKTTRKSNVYTHTHVYYAYVAGTNVFEKKASRKRHWRHALVVVVIIIVLYHEMVRSIRAGVVAARGLTEGRAH